jgi:archaellum component FlaF (FlaF/FlaG flagellin family)
MKFIAAILTVMAALTINAQNIDTNTKIFDTSYKSLQVKLVGNDYFPAIIKLGGDDHIGISFDHFSEDIDYLRYSLIHCNANWQPSELVESEYVDGFNYADIENHDFSATTFAHYVHYSFNLPNEHMTILKSGNYLVKIYPQDEPENVVIQARFMVCENAVQVSPNVTSRTDIDYNSHNQQLSFDVNVKNYAVQNMYTDLKAYVTQNGRTDNEVFTDKPMMVNGKVISFDHDHKLIFPAGNEFRRIETVTVNYPGMGVEQMEYHDPYYHATLRVDQPRADEPYIYDKTQFGRFTVRNADVDDSTTEADYIVTHFRLNTEGQLNGGKIYLDGEFTEHQFTPTTLMKYDPSTGLYICDMLLKQGDYNYQYLWVPEGSATGLTAKIEGNKYQTVNEYLVRVYNRQSGERYDRFIGYGIAFSGK